MFKSLYSGVSGMSSNMTELDVIGNNIANSNTVGFKVGRVTFNEMLTQTIRSASRPVAGGLGGTNPQQIGLGSRVGSIDTNFTQGNFQTTGIKTDLAIQGAGFFVLSDGTSTTFSRAGVFGLDSENFLVNPSTGLKVQGVMADEDAVVGAGPIGDLFIDPNMVVPARASESVQLSGNLDVDSDAQGTIRQSPSFLVAAGGADLLTAMSGEHDGTLGLRPGDTVSLNGTAGGVDLTGETYTVTSTSSYQDLVDWLNGLGTGMSFAIQPDGSLEATNGTGNDVQSLSLSVNGRTNFNQNFLFDATIAAGATDLSAGQLRGYADESDLISQVYDADGSSLGLTFTGGLTTLVIGGSRGGETLPSTAFAVDESATTVGDLMLSIQQTLGINSTPVAIDDQGQIVIEGEAGLDSALGAISITEQDQTNTSVETAFNFRQTQQARDQASYSTSTTVYDSLGGQHTVNFAFEKVPGLNEWIWTADVEGGEEILSGGSGRVRFSDSGAVANFTYDDDSGALSFRPQGQNEEGASIVTLAIDYGEIGGLDGLTQFEGTGRLQSIADGYQRGDLVDFEIDQGGMIVGRFSNDTMRNIGRIALATFNNPGGLVREANNTYSRTGNSGDAMTTFAGEGNGVTLNAGALESSNVDLAKEFTRLVIAQRSFQANSRVVTTGDTLMQELVNLVR